MPPKKQKLIIVGAGETAELAYDHFTHDSHYEVAGFTVEERFLTGSHVLGLPVVAFEAVEKCFPATEYQAFVAVSFTQLNRVRRRLLDETRGKGFGVASYVSSGASVWHNASIGENCFIFENATVQQHVRIADNVIIWSGSHILHRAQVDEDVFVSGGVTVGGFSKIGRASFIGLGANVIDEITVAPDAVIGAGAVVIRNTEPGKVYVGNPARVLEGRTSYSQFGIPVSE